MVTVLSLELSCRLYHFSACMQILLRMYANVTAYIELYRAKNDVVLYLMKSEVYKNKNIIHVWI